MKWLILIIVLTAGSVQAAVKRTHHDLTLGETSVRVNVYEKEGSPVTFFSPHNNEQTSLSLAKVFVEEKGGRLIEIESIGASGKPIRYLRFRYAGKGYEIDPNRIYTANGLACGTAPEIAAVIKQFADQLLVLILSGDEVAFRNGDRFLVAVHNNVDVDSRTAGVRSSDLTAAAFLKSGAASEYHEQAEGVYLSNTEEDIDNFVFLSGPQFVGYFAGSGFNTVVQKSAANLQSKKCSIDDGSLSVYAGLNGMPYICLEADGSNGSVRQRQMFEVVYSLAGRQTARTQID